MQLSDLITFGMLSLSLIESTVYGLAVAVKASIVGEPNLYFTCFNKIYPKPRNAVLKLWLSYDRE